MTSSIIAQANNKQNRLISVYLWAVVCKSRKPIQFYGSPIYKIGVSGTVRTRINKVAKKNKCGHRIILNVVTEFPYQLEKKLLEIGSKIPFLTNDGKTEFRAFNDAQLKNAISIMLKELPQTQ